jgi:hypothetical protein
MNTIDKLQLSQEFASQGARPTQDAPTVRLPVPPGYAASVDELAFATAAVEVDPGAEDAYWAAHFRSCPYIAAGTEYTEYRAAYRFGWESRRRLPDTRWDIAKPKLRAEWIADPANFLMSWGEAESAVRDAWNHAGAQRPN